MSAGYVNCPGCAKLRAAAAEASTVVVCRHKDVAGVVQYDVKVNGRLVGTWPTLPRAKATAAYIRAAFVAAGGAR